MSVTSDSMVAMAMEEKLVRTSAKIAKLVNLTPFQVTARLASMEKRKLVKRLQRPDGSMRGWVRVKSIKEIKTLEKQAEDAARQRKTRAFSGAAPTVIRDDGVPRFKAGHTEGWAMRYVPFKDDEWFTLFSDPHSGTEYVRASGLETADLIIDYPDLPSTRLKKFKGSPAERRAKEYVRQLELLAAEDE